MLYAYMDGVAHQVLKNISHGVPPPLPSSIELRGPVKVINNIMGPVTLHNSARDICRLFEQAQQVEPGRSPHMQQVQDLMSYLHLWNRYKQPRSDLILLVIKHWRPPAWAVECAKLKKAVLREIGRGQLAENMDTSATPREPAPQNITHTSVPAVPETAEIIPVGPTTTSHAPLKERITFVPTERSLDQAREQAPPPRGRPTMHREA